MTRSQARPAVRARFAQSKTSCRHGGHLPVQPRYRRQADRGDLMQYSRIGWPDRSASHSRPPLRESRIIMTTVQTSQLPDGRGPARPGPRRAAAPSARRARPRASRAAHGPAGQHARSPATCCSPSPRPRPSRPTPRSPKPRRRLRRGAPPRHRCAARWWPGSASCSSSTRPISPRWSPSRRARSPPRRSARCRR